ncbi:MAG TPA: MASE3 domain-containing protein, partial [Noviherbaspirillum sp.]|nr:MASE3 domain-containing protein [Noviherbaspirillum sp.]
ASLPIWVRNDPLSEMRLLLLLLAGVCIGVWQIPSLQILHGVPLMPLWLHIVLEVFSITVALLLFGIIWNAYSKERSGRIVILGCVFLAVGLIDLAHMLSFRGMPDFVTPAHPEKAINFWLASRVFAALGLLAVAILDRKPFENGSTRYFLLAGSLAATGLIYWLGLFHPDAWPHTYVDGVGLTGLKVAFEWGIIAIMTAAAVLLYRNARRDRSYDNAYVFGVTVISILSELCFTAYTHVTDVFNLLGHLLKIAAYLFLYRAAFVASVREPFRRLRVEVSERVRAEEALQQLNQSLEQRVAERTHQLERANKELESFSYSVSHDLRAPLRAIDGFSQILSKSYEEQLDAKGKDYLGRVQRASQRMGELIDDILHLSQISRKQVVRGRVDVTQLAFSVAEDLRQGDPGRQVQFLIAPGMEIEADAKLIRIVLENLMGNAFKFSGRRSDAKIEVGFTQHTGVPTIYVRDNGAGFSMDYAHKLFSPFQRLHTSSEFEGSGIGLATVQRIIHLHGGRVWADGVEGEGATFYFSCDPQIENAQTEKELNE